MMKTFLVVILDDDNMIVCSTKSPPPLPVTIKQVNSDVDTESEGYRAIFEAAKDAATVDLTPELFAQIMHSFGDYSDYIDKLQEQLGDL